MATAGESDMLWHSLHLKSLGFEQSLIDGIAIDLLPGISSSKLVAAEIGIVLPGPIDQRGRALRDDRSADLFGIYLQQVRGTIAGSVLPALESLLE